MAQGKGKTVTDNSGATETSIGTEVNAMGEVAEILSTLDPQARERVWCWLGQRFGFMPMPEFWRQGPPQEEDHSEHPHVAFLPGFGEQLKRAMQQQGAFPGFTRPDNDAG